jgi:ubiquinone/menaquinone biosynthesis C-methylase UbiE
VIPLKASGAAVFLSATLAALAASPLGGQHAPPGRFGNPADLDAYMARLASPARDAWQKPDEVVAALGLKPGAVACDIGAGPGYFTLRLARAVGPRGFVYAVDVEPKILDTLRERIAESGLRNVAPVLALADDPLLPEAACDLALIVDTYHHFPDRTAYLRRLARSLKPGGRIANIDYHKRETAVGPPLDHRLARETFLAEARGAGLTVVAEPSFLPYQYFVILRPR